jgi:fatty-acyl-CoA synthase
VIAPIRPDRLARIGARGWRLGPGLAAAAAMSAARWPEQPALVDDRGALTYDQLDQSGAAIAVALRDEHGVGPDRSLAIMCRNGRGFVQALLAGSRLGADVMLLNTDFPGPQLAQVLERERPAAIVHDEEFTAALDQAAFAGPRIIAWREQAVEGVTLDAFAARATGRPPTSRRQGRLTILTSGTTGTPKGAARKPSASAIVGPMTTLLDSLGLRARDPIMIAPPLFHGFGLAYLAIGMFLSCTVVVRRRFDPDQTLAAIERYHVKVLCAVPVMLQRILELDEQTRGRHDTSSLRAVFSGGSQLPPSVSGAFMDAFGEVVYNGYGSSETGIAAIAGPADLRAAPGTVGRPPHGVTIKILDEHRRQAPAGATGHVFIGGPLVFGGYTGGGAKEVIGELMNTGDLGHIDPGGRLLIDGREDDMIVSGGENVFPQEVAEVLMRHPAVADAAVLGVPDEQFGQRLRAYVVTRPGQTPSEDELKAHVKATVARYKVPREIEFLDELPRTPTGKIKLPPLGSQP